MPRAKRIRCYQCGRKNPAETDSCAGCGAPFLALCDCGHGVSLFASTCDACGHTLLPRTFPTRRLPFVRVLIALPLVALVAFAIWIALRPEPVQPWQLKAEAVQAYNEGNYEAALTLYRRAGELDPSDAAPQYMQAVCYRALKFPQTTYVNAALLALKLDPDMVQALMFLAIVEHQERGRLDLAIGYALQATAVPGATARAHRMLAELETKRPQPDLHLALEHLEQARDKDPKLPGLALLLARTQLRMYGETTPDRFPLQLQTALEQAKRDLDERQPEPGQEFALAAARAEIALGLQQHREAFLLADRALAGLPEDADPDLRARLLILRGQARQGAGQLGGALTDYREGLSLRPEAENALKISISLLGQPEHLGSLLTQAAREHDPRGEISSVLAGWHLDHGELGLARKAIDTARTRNPKNAFFAALEGSLRTAEGDLDGARRAYQEAIELAPRLIAPRVSLALLALRSEAVEDTVRQREFEAAKASLLELREAHRGHPAIHHALAVVYFSLGELDEARAALQDALDRSPGDARLWRLLGDARRSSTEPDALAQAADAYGRARQLRPDDGRLAALEAQAWLDSGNPTQALVTLDAAHRRLGETQQTLALRARAHRAQESWSRAAVDLARLRAMGDDAPGTLMDLVDSEFRAGRAADAVRRIEEVRAAGDEALAEALDLIAASHRDGIESVIERMEQRGPTTGLAELYLRAGRVDDAIGVLRGIHAEHPREGIVAMLLALALLDGEEPSPERIAEAEALIADLGARPDPGRVEFIRGRVALARGDAASAARELEFAATRFPTASAVQFLYGEALIRAGDRPKGMAILRKAMQMPGALPGMARMAAQRALQTSALVENAERAEELAAEALRFDPTLAPAGRRWIDLLVAREEFRRATNVAEAMLTVDSLTEEERTRFRFDALLCRVSLGELGRAESHLQSLEGPLRDSPLATTLRGIIELERGDHEAAEATFGSVLTAGRTNRVAAMCMIRSLVERGAFDAATEFAARWREQVPPGASVTVAAARYLRRALEFERALAQLQIVLANDPAHEPAVHEAVRVLARLERAEDAVAVADRYRETLPEDRRWYGELVRAKVLLTLTDRAEEARGTAVSLHGKVEGEYARTLCRIVEAEALLALRRAGEADATIAELTDAWEQDTPGTPLDRLFEARVRFVRGVSALQSGYFAAANSDLTRCLELDPESEVIRNNLAWTLSHIQGREARAHELAVGLTTANAGNPEYWDTRGACAEKIGNPGDAEASFREALTLFAQRGARAHRSRARTQLRLAALLRSLSRHEDSVREAREVLDYVGETQERRAAERFLRE